jgi:hypothetical protein
MRTAIFRIVPSVGPLITLAGLLGSSTAATGSPGATGPAAPVPTLAWAIIGRFRLVRDPADAEDVYQRFVGSYDHMGDKKWNRHHPWRSPQTWWDEKEHNYATGYVGVRSWDVRVTTNISGKCHWKVSNSEGTTALGDGNCSSRVIKNIRSGHSTVTAEPTTGGPGGSVDLEPRDVIISSIGDSYASGEGVPNLARYLHRGAFWIDRRCHRSLFSAPGLAALMYARINPHVSVTHVTFACSGASINMPNNQGGLLTEYEGAVTEKGQPPLPPQVDSLRDALTFKDKTFVQSQFLTVGIGGNDLGFGDVVRTAVFHNSVDELGRVINERVAATKKLVTDDQLKILASKLEEAHAAGNGTSVLITPYPNPANLWRRSSQQGSGVGSGDTSCGYGPTAQQLKFVRFPVLGITAAEIKRIDDTLMSKAIPELLGRLAVRLKATQTTGIEAWRNEFNEHGFCGLGLSNSGQTRWINTFSDSYELMSTSLTGSIVSALYDKEGTLGAMHPNLHGQAATGRWLLEQIVKIECGTHRVPKDDPVCDEAKPWRTQLRGYDASTISARP